MGLEVKSTGGTLEVLVSDTLQDSLCGMCGSCDGVQSNDMTTGPNSTCASQYPGEWPPAGSIVSMLHRCQAYSHFLCVQTDSVTMLGDSWLYDLDPTEPDLCTCKPEETKLCTDEENEHAEEVCSLLGSPHTACSVSAHCARVWFYSDLDNVT
jgi:hypothetical protein